MNNLFEVKSSSLKALVFLTAFVLILNSCKKDDKSPQVTENLNNEVKAAVSLDGAPFASRTANGNSTLFLKSIFYNSNNVIDTLFVVKGAFGIGTPSETSIRFMLTNITAAGTYGYPTNPSSRQQIASIYTIGDSYSPNIIISEPGTITIQALTNTFIQGTFQCLNSRLEITNGSFKGNFQ